MWPLLPLPETSAVLAVTVGTGAVSLPHLYPGRPRAVLARGGAALAAIAAGGLLAWGSGSPSVAARGVNIAWTTLMVLGPLSLGLVAAAAFARLLRAPAGVPASPRRRAFLQAGMVALPAAAVGGGAIGLRNADDPPRLPVIPLRFPDLHPDLEGLRILHLSDLHLGAGRRAADLEAFLERAAAERPDLIVLTGDVADDLGDLAEALRIDHRHRPRLGV